MIELSVLSRTDLTPEQRAAAQQEADRYRATVDLYESEPATGDGKKELLEKARAHEATREHAARQDPNFDLAEASLQLAIVLASVATVLGVGWLVFASIACGAIGLLATINGFALLVELPF